MKHCNHSIEIDDIECLCELEYGHEDFHQKTKFESSINSLITLEWNDNHRKLNDKFNRINTKLKSLLFAIDISTIQIGRYAIDTIISDLEKELYEDT